MILKLWSCWCQRKLRNNQKWKRYDKLIRWQLPRQKRSVRATFESVHLALRRKASVKHLPKLSPLARYARYPYWKGHAYPVPLFVIIIVLQLKFCYATADFIIYLSNCARNRFFSHVTALEHIIFPRGLIQRRNKHHTVHYSHYSNNSLTRTHIGTTYAYMSCNSSVSLPQQALNITGKQSNASQKCACFKCHSHRRHHTFLTC